MKFGCTRTIYNKKNKFILTIFLKKYLQVSFMYFTKEKRKFKG